MDKNRLHKLEPFAYPTQLPWRAHRWRGQRCGPHCPEGDRGRFGDTGITGGRLGSAAIHAW